MSTSGTYAGVGNQADIIDEAFERCGTTPAAIKAEHINAARRSLYFIMVANETREIQKFLRLKNYSFTVTAGQAAQPVAPEVVYITSASIKAFGSNDSVPLSPYTAAEYFNIPNKTTPATPTVYHHQINDAPQILVWGVPVNADTFNYQGVTRFQDLGAMSLNLQADLSAHDALAAELAYRLAVKFKPSRAMSLKADAAEALMLLKRFAVERGDVRFTRAR